MARCGSSPETRGAAGSSGNCCCAVGGRDDRGEAVDDAAEPKLVANCGAVAARGMGVSAAASSSRLRRYSTAESEGDGDRPPAAGARVMRSSTPSRKRVSISVMGCCVARYVRYVSMSARDGVASRWVSVKEDSTWSKVWLSVSNDTEN